MESHVCVEFEGIGREIFAGFPRFGEHGIVFAGRFALVLDQHVVNRPDDSGGAVVIGGVWIEVRPTTVAEIGECAAALLTARKRSQICGSGSSEPGFSGHSHQRSDDRCRETKFESGCKDVATRNQPLPGLRFELFDSRIDHVIAPD